MLGLSISLATSREKSRLKAIEQRTGTSIERLAPLAAGEASEPPEVLARDAPMDTIRISGGRKDKVRPGDIVGALTGEAVGLNAADVGKIEIHDRLSYVAIAKNVSRAAVKGLNSGRIKAKRFRASIVERGQR